MKTPIFILIVILSFLAGIAAGVVGGFFILDVEEEANYVNPFSEVVEEKAETSTQTNPFERVTDEGTPYENPFENLE